MPHWYLVSMELPEPGANVAPDHGTPKTSIMLIFFEICSLSTGKHTICHTNEILWGYPNPRMPQTAERKENYNQQQGRIPVRSAEAGGPKKAETARGGIRSQTQHYYPKAAPWYGDQTPKTGRPEGTGSGSQSGRSKHQPDRKICQCRNPDRK